MDNMNIEDIVTAKLADVMLSPQEEELFAEWYAQEENREYYRSLMRVQAGAVAGGMGNVDTGAAWSTVSPANRPPRRISMRRRALRYAAAAAVLLCSGAGTYLLLRGEEEQAVHPGEFKAVLIGSNGQEISLTDRMQVTGKNGTVFLTNTDQEGLRFHVEEVSENSIPTYNTVQISRGGYYRVQLSDGTVAWLNSDTKLGFYSAFKGATREVDLEGEAYFVVAKNDDKPFIVRTGDYEIRVTGTEFNVKSYRRGATATTLVEGAVQVETPEKIAMLSPGQQATMIDGTIVVNNVDIDDHVAWHKGDFSFPLSRLEDIMDELARWYDVDVEYEDEGLKEIRFSAEFSRDSEIRDIATILEKTQKISLSLRGRKITVKHG